MRLILIPREKVDWEMVYLSPVMFLGPLHVAVSSAHIDTCSSTCEIESSASKQRSIVTKIKCFHLGADSAKCTKMGI